MVALGQPLPLSQSTVPYAVSQDGSVIVGQSGGVAFIWDARDGMRRLDDVLSGLGVDLSGWSLKEARGISSYGSTIVREGTNPAGNRDGWIAVIPEPSTGLLFGVGLAVLAASRRRRWALGSAGS